MHPTSFASRRAILSLATHAALLCTALLIAFGPLTPPAGIVTSTAKPLSEVEPRTAINATNTPGDADSVFKITTPGSYYLTGNLTLTTGKGGIEITGSGVTVDLNGFQISGVLGNAAIFTSLATVERVAIRNGQIFGGTAGIALGAVPGVAVEHVNAEATSGIGIEVGANSRVEACIAKNNTGTGIDAGDGCTITDCTASSNNLGIVGGHGGSVTNCSAYLNDLHGILLGVAGAGVGCSAYSNGGNGFDLNAAATLTSSGAYGNQGIGINASQGCTIADCAAYNSDSNGITVRHGSTVTGCVAYENAGSGITGAQSGTIIGCSVFNNSLDGIQVFIKTLVLNCTCADNGANGGDGAGIHALSSDNRLEGNVCCGADRGIDVDGAGNFIARNTCSGNTTNWSIVTGNICLVVSAATAGPITGNAGGTAPGSTDPNANFTY